MTPDVSYNFVNDKDTDGVMQEVTTLRKILVQKRKSAGLTQDEASKLLNISLSFYRKIEQGTRNPGLELAQEIAKLFNTTVDEIFFENERHHRCPKAADCRFQPTGTDGH